MARHRLEDADIDLAPLTRYHAEQKQWRRHVFETTEHVCANRSHDQVDFPEHPETDPC